MDQYMLTKLDKLLDCQRDQLDRLIRIELSLERGRTDTTIQKPSFLARLKFPPLSQMILGGMATWAIGTAIGSFLRHGGDPMVLIEAGLKFLF
jgi:hypothetical protein